MIQVVAVLRRGVCLRRSTTGCQPRVPGQCQTTRVDDSYADLAHDYEWLFPDEVIGGGGTVGATSPGSEDFLEGILETLPPGARVLDSACGILRHVHVDADTTGAGLRGCEVSKVK